MFERRERQIDIEGLLAPYQYLDESLFVKGDDGKACSKKFSNDGNGVPRAVMLQLDGLSLAIHQETWQPESEYILSYIDLFVLYSNHLDQQRFNEKPELKEKERLVLNFLEAAFKLSPTYDYTNLSQYSPRELSSHAQLLTYLGKAERYKGVPVELRLEKLQTALNIARYLATQSLSKEEDPHHYQNRIATYELPVIYCLKDLKRFREAAIIIEAQLSLPSAFHRTQANIQLADTYLLQYQHEGTDLDKAFAYAHAAVEVSKTSGAILLEYNARISLMKVMQAAESREEASEMARSIISEMDSNPNCGAKPLHREAAEAVLAANAPSMAMGSI